MSKSTIHHPALEILFNSKTRIKVLKYFYRNHPANIGIVELAKKIQEPLEAVRREMKELSKIRLLCKTTNLRN